MDEVLGKQVGEINKRYDVLLGKRNSLPRRRPPSGSRAVEEQLIREEASAILSLVRHISYVGTPYQSNLDNVVAGCQKMMSDPCKW
jgi:hypothetical protein